RAHPAHRARLRGLRGGLRAGRPEHAGAGGRGLCLAAREPELRCRRRLRRAGDGGVVGGDRGLSRRAPGAAGAAGMSAARRWIFVTGVLALCAWVLLPIYLIALGALGGRAAVYQWPKSFLPLEASLSTLGAFLAVEGIWHAAINSVIAAALCMVFSIALGAPAGYALARFQFRGQNAYRLLILLTRAFPLAMLALPLTVSFIRLGLY